MNIDKGVTTAKVQLRGEMNIRSAEMTTGEEGVHEQPPLVATGTRRRF